MAFRIAEIKPGDAFADGQIQTWVSLVLTPHERETNQGRYVVQLFLKSAADQATGKRQEAEAYRIAELLDQLDGVEITRL